MTTTQNFQPRLDAYEPSLVRAAEACSKFAARLADTAADSESVANPFDAALGLAATDGLWLTLSGPNGSGKTMLARQLTDYARLVNPFGGAVWLSGDHGMLTSRRPKIVWLDEVRFVKRCKDGEYDLPEYLAEDWLVVIDDLGASRDKSGFAGDMLFRLCNARMGRRTIFTTNLSLAQIADRIDVRITSRLIRDGNTFVEIRAGDYALAKPRLPSGGIIAHVRAAHGDYHHLQALSLSPPS